MASEKKNTRLGKGLSALIGEYDSLDDISESKGVAEKAVDILKLKDIKPNPNQPRKVFNQEKLAELSASVAARGVLTPILVREVNEEDHKYQIIAGERRWRASRDAGLKDIPARILKTNEVELLEIGLIENIQREDLNALEEAEGYQSLISRFGKTQEALAEAVGKSRAHVTNMLRLLQLPESVREHLRHGEITAGHARAALGSDDPENIISTVIAKKLSVRDTERLVQKERSNVSSGGSAKATDPGEKDVDTEALEADLSRALGLEVDIRNTAKGGEIKIKYRHLEQLDEICRRLSRSA